MLGIHSNLFGTAALAMARHTTVIFTRLEQSVVFAVMYLVAGQTALGEFLGAMERLFNHFLLFSMACDAQPAALGLFSQKILSTGMGIMAGGAGYHVSGVPL